MGTKNVQLRYRATDAGWFRSASIHGGPVSMEPEQLFAMFEAVGDVLVYTKDAEAKWTACNRSTANFLGIEDEAEIIGLRDADIYPRRSVKTSSRTTFTSSVPDSSSDETTRLY